VVLIIQSAFEESEPVAARLASTSTTRRMLPFHAPNLRSDVASLSLPLIAYPSTHVLCTLLDGQSPARTASACTAEQDGLELEARRPAQARGRLVHCFRQGAARVRRLERGL
jgi:hypothetical protein